MLLWFGSLAILAGQLIAIAKILNVVAGLNKPAGCMLGAFIITCYSAAGGLHSAARVNVILISQASSEHTICFAVADSDVAAAVRDFLDAKLPN